MRGSAEPVTAGNVLRAALRYPARTSALIRWQGIRCGGKDWRSSRDEHRLLSATEARRRPSTFVAGRRWAARTGARARRGAPAPDPAVAARTGIHIRLPDGAVRAGDRSCPRRRRPLGLLHSARPDGEIGFGEAYMAGEWDSPELVAVLEALARQLDTLVPPPLQRFRRLYEARHPPPRKMIGPAPAATSPGTTTCPTTCSRRSSTRP